MKKFKKKKKEKKAKKAEKRRAAIAAPESSGGKDVIVWERTAPAPRVVVEPLSRDRIVRAAVKIADEEGLAAVSLRSVAALLDAGPMRLYGFVATKEELLDVMVDEVCAEMNAAGAIRGDFRKALRAIAQRIRHAATAHRWFLELWMVGRPSIGPNGLAFLEASLASLGDTPGLEKIDALMLVLGTVNAYVCGALRNEANELRAEVATGLNEAEWQNATWPYLERMLATGRFPMIARVVHEAKHPPASVTFERGLECVIDGIAARVLSIE